MTFFTSDVARTLKKEESYGLLKMSIPLLANTLISLLDRDFSQRAMLSTSKGTLKFGE